MGGRIDRANVQLMSNLLESPVDFRGACPGPLDIFILRGEKKFRGADALGDSLTSGRAPTAPQGHSQGRGWELAGAWTRPFHRHA